MNRREARRVAKFRAGLIIESVLGEGWDPQDLAERYGEDGLKMIRDELTDFAERLVSGGEASAPAQSIEVGDYHDEVARHRQTRPADYHPATAREPRRVLTLDGEALAGSNNGEGRSDWTPRLNVTVHTAVTGSGYAYGASVAACDGSMELSYEADLSALVRVRDVDVQLLCRRPGCRAVREEARTKE